MATHIPPTLSPDAIDTLTELTTILTKFRAAQASARRESEAAAAAAAGGPSSSSTNPNSSSGPNPPIGTPAPGAVTGTTPLPIPTTSNPNATASTLFTAKDLPQATDNLKHKLQRARQAVLTLPDMGRTIAQQEVEIKELEERKRKQIAMLARIREEGLQFARLEQSRRDEEGERMVE